MSNRLSFLVIVALAAGQAQAFSFRARWVERTGPVDTPIFGDLIESDGLAHRIRLQLGVFDDASGPAPSGGLIGWTSGTLAISRAINTRTPGRLTPFDFATDPNANGNPPLPGGDPFTTLTDIDATLGVQTPFWGCDANGNPLPQPNPIIRGRNTFMSIFEVTSASFIGSVNYSMTVSGNLIAATEWLSVGTPIPPDCGQGIPGSVTYVPVPTAPIPFTCVLYIEGGGPTPGAACTLGLGALLSVRRRRGHHHP
jgi:hypothetical protein